MDWSNITLPAMQIEAHFGDRLVPMFRERPRSVWEVVAQAVARNPDGEAIVFGDERLSWRETERRAAAIAGGFESLGLRPGDRLAVLIGNRTEFVLTLYAAARLGLVGVLLSTRLQQPEVAYMLNDCGAAAIVFETALADRVPDAAEVPNLRHRIVVEDGAGAPSLARLRDHAPSAAAAAVAEDDT
ncbi:MAG: AMP-binding protein, partial [Xanthobacteraceae bacterium]